MIVSEMGRRVFGYFAGSEELLMPNYISKFVCVGKSSLKILLRTGRSCPVLLDE